MRIIFGFLIKLNKVIFPKYWKRDLSKLSTFEKLIAGYKIWLGKRVLK